MDNRRAVDELLSMYNRYKLLLKSQSDAGLKLAKAKLLKQDITAIEKSYGEFTSELQRVSDAMTFANPIIWMLYKYEAYKDESQPIGTMHDFRVHCSKPGYICTKRFTFLNDELLAAGEQSLMNVDVYPDDMELSEVVDGQALVSISKNAAFMKQWDNFEFNTADGAVAKWENYQ